MERILRDSIEESARENGSIICFERGECMKKKHAHFAIFYGIFCDLLHNFMKSSFLLYLIEFLHFIPEFYFN